MAPRVRLIMWAVLVSVGFAQAREVEEQRPLDADAEKTAAPTVSELTDASALRVPPRLPAGAGLPGATIQPAGLCTQRSFIDGPGTVMAVAGNEEQFPAGNKVVVHAMDVFGNAREGGIDAFVLDPLMDSAVVAAMLHVGGGKYEITFWWSTPNLQEAYDICPGVSTTSSVAVIGGCKRSREDVQNSDSVVGSASIFIHHPTGDTETDPKMATVTCLVDTAKHGVCGSEATAGVETSFAIEARDSRGRAQYGGHDSYSAVLTGPERIKASVRHLRLNYYEVTYTPTVAGLYVLVVTLHRDGKAEQLVNVPASVTVSAGSPSESHSRCAVDRQQEVGRPVVVDVSCDDALGNGASARALVSMQLAGSDKVITRKVHCEGNARTTLRSPTAGTYTVSAQIWIGQHLVHVQNSPVIVRLEPGPVDPASTRWVNSQPTLETSAVQAFVFQASDTYGNSVPADHLNIDLRVMERGLQGSEAMLPTVESARNEGNGTYRATVACTRTGQFVVLYTVSELNGALATVGPLELEIRAGTVDINISEIDVGSGLGGSAGQQIPIHVRLRDSLGNSRSKLDTLHFALRDHRSRVVVKQNLSASGTFIGSYSVQVAGMYVPQLWVDGVLDYTAPPLVVTFGPLAAAQIFGHEKTLADGGVPAEAGVPVSYKVRALDAFDNVRTISDCSLSFVFDKADGSAAFTSDAVGVYTVTILINAAGPVSLRTVLSSAISTVDAEEVRLAVQPATAAGFDWPLMPEPVRAGEMATLLLVARDQFGNVATPNGSRTTALSTQLDPRLSGPELLRGTVRTADDGAVTVVFNPTKAGAYTATPGIASSWLVTTAPKLVIVPAPADATHSIITGSGMVYVQPTVYISLKHSTKAHFNVHLRDHFDNHVVADTSMHSVSVDVRTPEGSSLVCSTSVDETGQPSMKLTTQENGDLLGVEYYLLYDSHDGTSVCAGHKVDYRRQPYSLAVSLCAGGAASCQPALLATSTLRVGQLVASQFLPYRVEGQNRVRWDSAPMLFQAGESYDVMFQRVHRLNGNPITNAAQEESGFAGPAQFVAALVLADADAELPLPDAWYTVTHTGLGRYRLHFQVPRVGQFRLELRMDGELVGAVPVHVAEAPQNSVSSKTIRQKFDMQGDFLHDQHRRALAEEYLAQSLGVAPGALSITQVTGPQSNNATALTNNIAATMQQQLANVAQTMASGNFSAQLATAVTQAGQAMAAGCTAVDLSSQAFMTAPQDYLKVDEYTCDQVNGGICHYCDEEQEFPEINGGLCRCTTGTNLLTDRTNRYGTTGCTSMYVHPAGATDAAGSSIATQTGCPTGCDSTVAGFPWISACTPCAQGVESCNATAMLSVDAGAINMTGSTNITQILASVVVVQQVFTGYTALSGSGLQTIRCGIPTSFNINVYDKNNNPVTSGLNTFDFAWDTPATFSATQPTITVNNDINSSAYGQYTVDFTVNNCDGTAKFDLAVDDINVTSCDTTFDCAVACAEDGNGRLLDGTACTGAQTRAIFTAPDNCNDKACQQSDLRSVVCSPGPMAAVNFDGTAAASYLKSRTLPAALSTAILVSNVSAGTQEEVLMETFDQHINDILIGGASTSACSWNNDTQSYNTSITADVNLGCLSVNVRIPQHLDSARNLVAQTEMNCDDMGADCGITDYGAGAYEVVLTYKHIGIYVVTATIMGETVGGFPTPVALQGALHGGSVQTQIVHAAMLPGLTTAVSSTESATRSTCNHVGTVHETRTMVAGEAQVACEEIITVVQYDRFLNPIYTAPQATVTGCPTGTTCSQFFVRYSYDGVIYQGNPTLTNSLMLSFSATVTTWPASINMTVYWRDGSGNVLPTDCVSGTGASCVGRPIPIMFRAAPCTFSTAQSASTVNADGQGRLIDCIAGQPSVFDIQTKDAYGNVCEDPIVGETRSTCGGAASGWGSCAWSLQLNLCGDPTDPLCTTAPAGAVTGTICTVGSQASASYESTVHGVCPGTASSTFSGVYRMTYVTAGTGYYRVALQLGGAHLVSPVGTGWLPTALLSDGRSSNTGARQSPFVILSDTAAIASVCVADSCLGSPGDPSTSCAVAAGQPSRSGLSSTTGLEAGKVASFDIQAKGIVNGQPQNRRGSGELWMVTVETAAGAGYEAADCGALTTAVAGPLNQGSCSTASITYLTNGFYTVRYSASSVHQLTSPWMIKVNVHLKDPNVHNPSWSNYTNPISGSPFTVRMVPTDTAAPYSSAHPVQRGATIGDGLTSAQAGAVMQFQLVGRDMYNNSLTFPATEPDCVSNLFSATMTAPGGSAASNPSNDPLATPAMVSGTSCDRTTSTYTMEYRLEIAGVYSLNPQFSGADICTSSALCSSPFSIVVGSAYADGSSSYVSPSATLGTSGSVAFPYTIAGQVQTYQLHPFDQYSNRLTRPLCKDDEDNGRTSSAELVQCIDLVFKWCFAKRSPTVATPSGTYEPDASNPSAWPVPPTMLSGTGTDGVTLASCQSNSQSTGVTVARSAQETALADGSYVRVYTFTTSSITKAGTYRVEIGLTEADGSSGPSTAPHNTPFEKAIQYAAASAPHTSVIPSQIIAQQQAVTYDMQAKDQYYNLVEDADLQWKVHPFCQPVTTGFQEMALAGLRDGAGCVMWFQKKAAADIVDFDPVTVTYTVNYYVNVEGSAALLYLTMELNGQDVNNTIPGKENDAQPTGLGCPCTTDGTTRIGAAGSGQAIPTGCSLGSTGNAQYLPGTQMFADGCTDKPGFVYPERTKVGGTLTNAQLRDPLLAGTLGLPGNWSNTVQPLPDVVDMVLPNWSGSTYYRPSNPFAGRKAFAILVRAKLNDPQQCYIISEFAGHNDTSLGDARGPERSRNDCTGTYGSSFASAGLASTPKTCNADVLNTYNRLVTGLPPGAPEPTGGWEGLTYAEKKTVGQDLRLSVQSMRGNDSPSSVKRTRDCGDVGIVVCNPSLMLDLTAMAQDGCCQLDEFEVVAHHTASATDYGPFADECTEVALAQQQTSDQGASYVWNTERLCVKEGEYDLRWSTTVSGDYQLKVRSLGVLIQTAQYSDRFSQPVLSAEGLNMPIQTVHVYPAPMAAAQSTFTLVSSCVGTPCLTVGVSIAINVVGRDMYRNQLEEEASFGPSEALGLRAELTTMCALVGGALPAACIRAVTDFKYDNNATEPGHFIGSVMPWVAGPAKLRTWYDDGSDSVDNTIDTPGTRFSTTQRAAQDASWRMCSTDSDPAVADQPAMVRFGTGHPVPNNAALTSSASVAATLRGYEPLDPLVTASYYCEYLGNAVSGLVRSNATVSTTRKPNLVTVTITAVSGAEGVVWDIRKDPYSSAHAVFSAGPYSATGTVCAENVATGTATSVGQKALLYAPAVLALTASQRATVYWTSTPSVPAATCASAISLLSKYGVSCDSDGVAAACPVFCGNCASETDTTITYKVPLEEGNFGGRHQFTQANTWLEAGSPDLANGPAIINVSIVDETGIVLMPPATWEKTTSVATGQMTVQPTTEILCDEALPVVQLTSSTVTSTVNFELAAVYDMGSDTDFNRVAYAASRPYNSHNFAPFTFYQNPTFTSLAPSMTANELASDRMELPRAPVFKGTARPVPSFASDRLFLPAESKQVVLLTGAGISNGPEASKQDYGCRLVGTNDTVSAIATYLSDTVLQCKINGTISAESAYEFQLSKNGVDWSSTNMHVQTYQLSSIFPDFGAVEGVETVEFTITEGPCAVHGTDCSSQRAYCRFGDWDFPATYADTEVPFAGPNGDDTNALGRSDPNCATDATYPTGTCLPIAGTQGDVVLATYVANSGRTWADFCSNGGDTSSVAACTLTGSTYYAAGAPGGNSSSYAACSPSGDNSSQTACELTGNTFTPAGSEEKWTCPLPNIGRTKPKTNYIQHDDKTFKPRNVESPVRFSYDGQFWSNSANFFYFDQPDLKFPIPPVGPTSGGSIITLPMPGYSGQSVPPDPTTDSWILSGGLGGSSVGRLYSPRAAQYKAWCRFKITDTRVVTGSLVNATVSLTNDCAGDCLPGDDYNVMTIQCETPANPEPGSKYLVEVSLDDQKTWAYTTPKAHSAGRMIQATPEFFYYAETAIVTEDESTNYFASNDFRGKILCKPNSERGAGPFDAVTNPNGQKACNPSDTTTLTGCPCTVDVRFAYSCGYTTGYAPLVKCRFGGGSGVVSDGYLDPINIGATTVNQLTCDVPEKVDTGTVPIQISLNGADYTDITTNTQFVYFGRAVSLSSRWQVDTSSSATVIGSMHTVPADRVTHLPVIYVEILDDKGSFVSEDDKADAVVRIKIVKTLAGVESDVSFWLESKRCQTVGAVDCLSRHNTAFYVKMGKEAVPRLQSFTWPDEANLNSGEGDWKSACEGSTCVSKRDRSNANAGADGNVPCVDSTTGLRVPNGTCRSAHRYPCGGTAGRLMSRCPAIMQGNSSTILVSATYCADRIAGSSGSPYYPNGQSVSTPNRVFDSPTDSMVSGACFPPKVCAMPLNQLPPDGSATSAGLYTGVDLCPSDPLNPTVPIPCPPAEGLCNALDPISNTGSSAPLDRSQIEGIPSTSWENNAGQLPVCDSDNQDVPGRRHVSDDKQISMPGFCNSNGRAMFVGLRMDSPKSPPAYEVRLYMQKLDPEWDGDRSQTPAISNPDSSLGLTVVTGPTSIPDTVVLGARGGTAEQGGEFVELDKDCIGAGTQRTDAGKELHCPQLAITPRVNFQLRVQARDSAGNDRSETGDTLRLRTFLNDRTAACGAYVRAPDNMVNGESLNSHDFNYTCPDTAEQYFGATRSMLCNNHNATQARVICGWKAHNQKGVSRAHSIQLYDLQFDKDPTNDVPVCMDDLGYPICQPFEVDQDINVTLNNMLTLITGVGGAATGEGNSGPGQPTGSVDLASPGQYRLESQVKARQEICKVDPDSREANEQQRQGDPQGPGSSWRGSSWRLPSGFCATGRGDDGSAVTDQKAPLRAWGSYTLVIEGCVENCGASTGQVWREIRQSPLHGLISPVDCTGNTNPSGYAQHLVGAVPDAEGQQCSCRKGFQFDGASTDKLLPGQVVCNTCPKGSYKGGNADNSRPCDPCPPTTTTKAGLCEAGLCNEPTDCKCQDDYYDFRNMLLSCMDVAWFRFETSRYMPELKKLASNGVHCAPCPTCVDCYENGTITIHKGYWTYMRKDKMDTQHYFKEFEAIETDIQRAPVAPRQLYNMGTLPSDKPAVQAYKCLHSPGGGGRTCLGGTWQEYDQGEGCSLGATGATCAECALGFKKADWGCESCQAEAARVAESETNWAHMGMVAVMVLFAAIMIFIAMKRAKSDDVLKIKILIAFGQVTQSFAATYKIQWPDGLKSIFGMFSIVNFDLFTMGSIECTEALRWTKNFYSRFLTMVFMPAAFAGLLIIGWKVQMVRSNAKRAKAGKSSLLEQKIAEIEVSGQWGSRFFFMLILTYLKVSATILEMFKCRQFEPHPESTRTGDFVWDPNDPDEGSDDSDRNGLEADMSLDCDGPLYLVYYAFAIICVFIYPLGVPAFFILLMWRERDQLHDAINQKKFGFLFADYVAIYFLWEVVDLMRKLMLSGLLIFFRRGSVAQLMVAMLIALMFLECQLRFMPFNDILANVVQIVAFNAIFLNLIGAMLLKVKFEPGLDDGIGETFANGFLIVINVSVPVFVMFMLAFSIGYDMYLMSIGRAMQSGLAGKSRMALMQAIGARKDHRKENVRRKKNLVEGGAMGVYHFLWLREDVDEALLAEELAYLEKRRDERDKAIILFRQAEVHHEEKREWYRFVYNHTKTEEEFNEIVQTESLASYKRLMLGLDEEMEDDIHERVTREVTQAGNEADDDSDDEFSNPMFATGAKGGEEGEDGQPKKKKKKKKSVEDGWFGGEEDEPLPEEEPKKKKKKKKKKKSVEEDDEVEEAPVKKKKKKKPPVVEEAYDDGVTDDDYAAFLAKKAERASQKAARQNDDSSTGKKPKKKSKKESKKHAEQLEVEQLEYDPTDDDVSVGKKNKKKKKKKKKDEADDW